MDPWKRVLKRRADVVARRVAGESLLIPIKGQLADMQRIFALDGVAEHIWERLDGVSSLDDILRSVLSAFAVEEPTAKRDLLALVAGLESAGLVEPVVPTG